MASNQELVQLFNKGELGKLLAREFKGERGRVHSNQDLDLIITCASEAVTPKESSIESVVSRHFRALGYVVEGKCNAPQKCYQAQIFYKNREEGCANVIVTTFYPFPTLGQGRASLRLNTNLVFSF